MHLQKDLFLYRDFENFSIHIFGVYLDFFFEGVVSLLVSENQQILTLSRRRPLSYRNQFAPQINGLVSI